MRRRFEPLMDCVKPDDMAMMKQPLDFIGLNIYSRWVVVNDPGIPTLEARGVVPDDVETTAMGWEIYPESIYAI